jgi:DNA-binding transcriptional LysR family regulator
MRRIDLNLFHVFDVMLRHRSVTEAAKELGVTQSGMTRALARLRVLLSDELFIRGAGGMHPTPRALELESAVKGGLSHIAAVLDSEPFSPSRTARTFNIAASDYAAADLLPALAARLAQSAPHIDLRVFPLSRGDVVSQLDGGRVDLVLGWFSDLPDRLRRKAVLVEEEALVTRPGHPLTQGKLTKERLFSYSHVVVEFTGGVEEDVGGFFNDRGVMRRIWMERLLEETNIEDGLAARVAVSVPYYSAVAPLVRATENVATLPRSLAVREAALGYVVILELPYEPLTINYEAIWHQRADRDAGLHWLLKEISEAAATIKATDSGSVPSGKPPPT